MILKQRSRIKELKTNVTGASMFGNYGKQYDKNGKKEGRTPSYYTFTLSSYTGSKFIYLEASGSNNKTVYLQRKS